MSVTCVILKIAMGWIRQRSISILKLVNWAIWKAARFRRQYDLRWQ